jgi:hypothetical protein
MPASREKAPNEPSDIVTARSKRRNTRHKTAAAGSNWPQSHCAEIENPEHGASSANAVEAAGKSFPHRLGLGPLHRESFNNRYHCGFAQ